MKIFTKLTFAALVATMPFQPQIMRADNEAQTVGSSQQSHDPKENSSDHRNASVTWTKWVTALNPAPGIVGTVEGIVGGDIGDGTMTGEAFSAVLQPDGVTTIIEAEYHFFGSKHSFSFRFQAVQTFHNDNGVISVTGVLVGVVTEGWLKGNAVSGEYRRTICDHVGINPFCFEGTLEIARGSKPGEKRVRSQMTMNAGTVFNLSPVFDAGGNPVFPWPHEVRGVVQVSNLGNAIASFLVRIDAGSACDGGHDFCLSGTMKITTLAGDELNADVIGWADSDPNDLKPTPSMYLLHYDVTITGGTGKLQGAAGRGRINGAFNFCGGDCFCESYVGVATWLYEGGLNLPRK